MNEIGTMTDEPALGKLICTGTHPYSFRAGQPAEVIGVGMHTPEGLEPRAVFRVRFPDGVEDLVPINSDGWELTGDITFGSIGWGMTRP